MQQFLATAAPAPWVIMGQRLQPLTIGHLIYLERFDCSPVKTTDQLVTAIVICSQPVEEVLDTLQDPWLHLKVGFWRWRLGRKIDWVAKLKLWGQYLKDGSRPPTVILKSDSNGMKHSRTPFLQHLKVTLQSKLNYTPAEAFAAPFSQALWDYYTLHEIEGTMEIADPEERQAMKSLADKQHAAWVEQAIAESTKRARNRNNNGV